MFTKCITICTITPAYLYNSNIICRKWCSGLTCGCDGGGGAGALVDHASRGNEEDDIEEHDGGEGTHKVDQQGRPVREPA